MQLIVEEVALVPAACPKYLAVISSASPEQSFEAGAILPQFLATSILLISTPLTLVRGAIRVCKATEAGCLPGRPLPIIEATVGMSQNAIAGCQAICLEQGPVRQFHQHLQLLQLLL